ncbi:MAG: PEGA domain-containing protein [Acidobacteria bacterium]|jgi:hypothetical protein|nr:PEGA domain-containing protein [Acidobacteriota bacterium]
MPHKVRYNFLFVIGLILTLGLTSAFANYEGGGDKKNKKDNRPKNTGVLSVKTTPGAYTVKVDGQVVGMSGVGTAAEFFLAPGMHRVEVEGPNGQTFSRDIEIRRDQRNCICLKTVEHIETRACPYNIQVNGPEKVLENDLITFTSQNAVANSPTPINYRWTVSPEAARITSGQGTSAITVDTSGLGSQPVTANLDVTDDVYGAKCRQSNSVLTNVEKQEMPQAKKCDIFESKAFDDDKARFDNCTLELQSTPDSQIYIILYQGTDKFSKTNTADKLGKRTLDYLVKTRGIDPRRIVITNWGMRPRTMYEIYIIPPGAQPPAPQ